MATCADPIPYPLDYQLTLRRIIFERLARLHASGAQAEAARLQDALARLQRCDFGACIACGGLIPYPEIAADPAARYCRNCAAN